MTVNASVFAYFSVFGFIVVLMGVLYMFREKKSDRLPSSLKYDYEGSISNSKLNTQVNRNAFFHTRGRGEIGRIYGPNIDRKYKKK